MSPPHTFADPIAQATADQALAENRRRHVVSDLKCFVREAGPHPWPFPFLSPRDPDGSRQSDRGT